MCPQAWRIFIRSIQLSCALLFGAILLLIAWDGDSRNAYSLYQTALTLNECAQLPLLIAVIVPPCVEERSGTY